MPFILLILGLALLLVMLVSFIGLVGFAVANVAIIALALLGGLGISALLGGVSPGTTLVAAGALFILLASAKRRKSRKARRGFDLDLAAQTLPETPGQLPPEPAPQTPLELAFAATLEHADWARSRLAVAYESCRLFLRVADRTPLDMDAGQLAIRIRKRIPEHVDECLDKCSLATPSERHTILEELVFTLEKVGASADRHRSRLIVPVSDEMTVQRRHLTRDDDSPLTG